MPADRRPLRRLAAAAALAGVAAAVAGGCGAGAEGDPVPAPEGRRGGLLTVLALGPVTTLDPAAAGSPDELAIAHATQRPLYSHRPGDPKRTVPDLASGPPGLAPDGRKVTVTIRPGVRFSPPVRRVVTSSDVKYAVERAIARGPAAPGSAYFADLVGARAFAAGRAREIAGIETPDDRRLVFRLGRPTGGALAAALSLPLTAPVPRDYAVRADRQYPGYGARPVATGPYLARAPAAAGAGQGPIDLVRNPSWDRRADERPAFADRIRVVPAAGDAASVARRVAGGTGLLTAGLPADAAALAAAARPRGARLTVVRRGALRYVAVNPRVPPFGDPDARRALAAALDREAMREAAGGRLAGDLATHFIPPGVRGFEEAGGVRGPGVDFLAPPRADVLLARRYLARSPRRRAGRPLVVAGGRGGAEERQTQLVVAALRRLGLAARVRPAAAGRAAAALPCDRARSPVAVCPNASRLRRIADAQGILDPPTGQARQARRDALERADRGVGAAIERAGELTDPTARTRAWAAIDRLLTARAAAVPWLWESAVLIAARDVSGVPNRATGAWDLSYSSLR